MYWLCLWQQDLYYLYSAYMDRRFQSDTELDRSRSRRNKHLSLRTWYELH